MSLMSDSARGFIIGGVYVQGVLNRVVGPSIFMMPAILGISEA